MSYDDSDDSRSEGIFISGAVNNTLRGRMSQADGQFPSTDELSEWIATLQAAWRGRLPFVSQAAEESLTLFQSLASEIGQCGTPAELAEVGRRISLCTPRLQRDQVESLRVMFRTRKKEVTQ